MTEKLLNLKEAAQLLELPPEQVESWVREGRLPAFWIGGEFLRFRPEELERFRRERLQPPTLSTTLQDAAGAEQYTFSDGFKDFFYFNDFYLISLLLAIVALWAIVAL